MAGVTRVIGWCRRSRSILESSIRLSIWEVERALVPCARTLKDVRRSLYGRCSVN